MADSLANLEDEIMCCRKCPRLTEWREEVARVKRKAYLDWEYWGKPIPGFGDHQAKVLVVGLAPGAHGSNRTGRMFTGDASGEILFRNLYMHVFSTKPTSSGKDDGLELRDIFISAVCRCVPPGNKPDPVEISTCLPYLSKEIDLLSNIQGVVALGRIAYEGIVKTLKARGLDFPRNTFGHGKLIQPDGADFWVLQSYHPSRQNTQTGRLTESMFSDIWVESRRMIR
jgi:uracil-DNA glycosylase family 4